MKIACIGDLHITTKTPINRKDDYFRTQLKKFRWAVREALNENCSLFCMPGDIFDSPRVSLDAVQQYMNFMKWTKQKHFGHAYFDFNFIAIYGQHDLFFHSIDSREKTPLNLLKVSGVLDIPIGLSPLVFQSRSTEKPVRIWGSSWETPVVSLLQNKDEYCDVLLIHTMMIDQKLWKDQENYTDAQTFLRECPFDLVISGDNHKQFMVSIPSKKFLINAGSMMRSKVDQREHEPALYIYDTNMKTVTRRSIPIENAEIVLDLTKYEATKERDERIESFVNSLDNEIDLSSMNFKENVLSFCHANQVDNEIMGIINECFGG